MNPLLKLQVVHKTPFGVLVYEMRIPPVSALRYLGPRPWENWQDHLRLQFDQLSGLKCRFWSLSIKLRVGEFFQLKGALI